LKIFGFSLDFNYFSFSHPNSNPTYLLKHEFLSLNNQFYPRIWSVEHYSVHAYMVWSQKFRLTPDPDYKSRLRQDSVFFIRTRIRNWSQKFVVIS